MNLTVKAPLWIHVVVLAGGATIAGLFARMQYHQGRIDAATEIGMLMRECRDQLLKKKELEDEAN